jgi:hypothetical protein
MAFEYRRLTCEPARDERRLHRRVGQVDRRDAAARNEHNVDRGEGGGGEDGDGAEFRRDRAAPCCLRQADADRTDAHADGLHEPEVRLRPGQRLETAPMKQRPDAGRDEVRGLERGDDAHRVLIASPAASETARHPHRVKVKNPEYWRDESGFVH